MVGIHKSSSFIEVNDIAYFEIDLRLYLNLMMPSKFIRYRSLIPVVDQESIKDSYCWNAFLEEILVKLDRCGDVNSRCPAYVVPVEYFYQAPFAEYMKYIDTSVKIEVALYGDYGYNSKSMKLYWFARVMKVAGYRLLLRYEGMDEIGDNAYDFWVNIGSEDIRPIGYCAEKTETRALVPPEVIHKRQSNWRKYILCQIHTYRTIAINWPKIQVGKLSIRKFKKGDHVELLDSIVTLRVRPACVEKVIGTRIHVRVSHMFLDRSTVDDNDSQITEGVWMDQDSPLIFPVGWALKVGYKLDANDDYINHAKEISVALKLESDKNPYEKRDTKPSTFKTNIEAEAEEDNIKWEKGMKLEVLDPLGTWKELRVSTVIEVMNNGFLKIGFDGEKAEDDSVPLHSTSELLFPVGYAEKYGIKLKGPKNTGFFDWTAYLRQSNAIAAPEELFNKFNDDVLSNFKIGAKLEAADMCEPYLICPATIAGHHGRLLRIEYDGWGSSFNQLFDYRSANIFPLGWCEMHGYKLEAPKIPKISRISHVPKKKRKKECKDNFETANSG
uniref:Scm-like with four MBT domains protein 2 n=1 Tax=Loa loa TaxID=7209 RepID=A0A1I7VZ48_LOALO